MHVNQNKSNGKIGRVTKRGEDKDKRKGKKEILVKSLRDGPPLDFAHQDSSAVNRHMLHIQITIPHKDSLPQIIKPGEKLWCNGY